MPRAPFRELERLWSLKLFLVLGVVLFHWSSAYTAALLGAGRLSIRHLLLHSLPVSFALLFVVSIVAGLASDASRDKEVSGDPLSWSWASTSGTTHFLAALGSLGYPALEHPSSLSPLSLAFAGVTAATVGVSAHLRVYWESRRVNVHQSPEALRAEQQVWTAVFSGAVSWTGLLISGALLALAFGTFGNVRQLLPAQADSLGLLRLLLSQGLVAGYTIATTLLWLLRPLHRRMEQIADSIGSQAST
jgi:hypothetical protein